MKVEFINPFLSSLINVLATMAQTELTPGKPKIKKGEVGRWVILFNQILDKYRHQDPEFISLWENEINKFYERFVNSKVLFG